MTGPRLSDDPQVRAFQEEIGKRYDRDIGPQEAKFLMLIEACHGGIASWTDLANGIWGSNLDALEHDRYQHLRTLRRNVKKKLGDLFPVINVYGRGYRADGEWPEVNNGGKS